MQQIDSLIAAKIASLRPFTREDWRSGPYTEEEVRTTERQLGRSLDPNHRDMLKDVGGRFCFESGTVEVGNSELSVAEFYGVSEDDLNIADKWHGYRDVIPQRWYPFAENSDGYMYCLTDEGAVQLVEFGELEDELPEQVPRPETAGKRVADSFVQFVMSLRLPDWAVAYLREPSGKGDGET